MNIKEIEEYLESLKTRYESNLVEVRCGVDNETIAYDELANGTVEDEAIERAVADMTSDTEALLKSYIKGNEFKNERMIKYLTFEQLRDLHNDNEEVIMLMGSNLSGNKQLLRDEMRKRRPDVFR